MSRTTCGKSSGVARPGASAAPRPPGCQRRPGLTARSRACRIAGARRSCPERGPRLPDGPRPTRGRGPRWVSRRGPGPGPGGRSAPGGAGRCRRRGRRPIRLASLASISRGPGPGGRGPGSRTRARTSRSGPASGRRSARSRRGPRPRGSRPPASWWDCCARACRHRASVPAGERVGSAVVICPVRRNGSAGIAPAEIGERLGHLLDRVGDVDGPGWAGGSTAQDRPSRAQSTLTVEGSSWKRRIARTVRGGSPRRGPARRRGAERPRRR